MVYLANNLVTYCPGESICMTGMKESTWGNPFLGLAPDFGRALERSALRVGSKKGFVRWKREERGPFWLLKDYAGCRGSAWTKEMWNGSCSKYGNWVELNNKKLVESNPKYTTSSSLPPSLYLSFDTHMCVNRSLPVYLSGVVMSWHS